MSERSNEHDWKSCDVKASAGSNPVLCARKKTNRPLDTAIIIIIANVSLTGVRFFLPITNKFLLGPLVALRPYA